MLNIAPIPAKESDQPGPVKKLKILEIEAMIIAKIKKLTVVYLRAKGF